LAESSAQVGAERVSAKKSARKKSKKKNLQFQSLGSSTGLKQQIGDARGVKRAGVYFCNLDAMHDL
jgi:hypothetical protein